MNVWMHQLIVPSKYVGVVADLLIQEQAAVTKYYNDYMQQHFHESCRPPKLQIVSVNQTDRAVQVVVQADDVRINVLTDALEYVIPANYQVRYPRWG